MARSGPLWFWGVLLEFYGRDRPFSVVSLDGNSHAVKFVQPDIRNGPGFSIGENDSFPDKFGLHVPQRGEDRRRAELHSGHGYPRSQSGERVRGVVMPLKGVQVVTGTGQSGDRNNPVESSEGPVQVRPHLGERPSIGLKMSGNQIVRTPASADVDLRCGGADQITVAIERIQEARLIGVGIRLNSSQCVFADEK